MILPAIFLFIGSIVTFIFAVPICIAIVAVNRCFLGLPPMNEDERRVFRNANALRVRNRSQNPIDSSQLRPRTFSDDFAEMGGKPWALRAFCLVGVVVSVVLALN